MAITRSELKTAENKIVAIEARWAEYQRLSADAVAYAAGEQLTLELQAELRSSIAAKIANRLETIKANIDADVADVRTVVTDYVLP